MSTMHSLSRLLFGSILCGAAIASSTGGSAQTIACGSDYTVSSGDSLSQIAQAAYADTSKFTLIYSANASIIGPSPELIRVGQVLRIPCLEQSTPSVADNSLIRIEKTTEALPLPDYNKIRVVTGTDFAPFTDEGQEQGGMVTEIVNVALSVAEGSPAYQIDFINDWGAHQPAADLGSCL